MKGLSLSSINFLFIKLLVSTLLSNLSGCGYGLQRSDSAYFKERDIQTLYISPIENMTDEPGIENKVFKALVQSVEAGRKLKVVGSKDKADAMIEGIVTDVSWSAGGSKTFGQTTVATAYTAKLRSHFYLKVVKEKTEPIEVQVQNNKKVKTKLKKKEKTFQTVRSSSFDRSKPFNIDPEMGTLGTTTALIKESEFNRALTDLVKAMMIDVNEYLFEIF